ncbi:hypothetical protein DFR50_11018 [Roseiarcus fermentans]|uniref:Cupin domain-containing protein n=1 Tax=Roseiarcus fermentans TaxID=1473586 RepID=A0A366FJU3_9HYPH|nr:DHCW motif cupin fold protein [Roseiarcus fermentans]RBP13995.1 hypothetical protein DFR50_11018 [Roseiarcus fermentans]
MRLADIPEERVDWSREAPTRTEGASGHALTRRRLCGALQQRVVEYAPGYLADHWCAKGHVLFVLGGALVIEHEDGSPAIALDEGMSWAVGDDARPAHRVRTEGGARVFIVD